MKFIVEWSIASEHYKQAVTAFLTGGAPMPDGLTALGRWHGPGSRHGWLLCETDDPTALYQHLSHWAPLLDTNATPVIEDEDAAIAMSREYG